MLAPLAKWIDWSALQFWWALRLRSLPAIPVDDQSRRLEEALQFLDGPDFIPAESPPARVGFNGPVQFSFPTPRPCEFAENNVVYGRFYRCAARWPERPVIVLLHGGGDFLNHRFRFPWIIPACNRAGFNAATLVAPYHFQRRPRRPGPGNYLQLVQAFAQAVAEIRALTGWLLAQGCPAVALWGISYGGWLAGLTAGRDARLAAVVLTVPGVRMDYQFSRAERVIWRQVRELLQAERAAREALNASRLNLTLVKPVIPRENILLMAGLYDMFVGPEPVEELWQAWGQPDLWRLSHGHISWMGAPGLTGRVLRWLAPRLNRAAAQKQTE